ncbi:hypothetical protein [Chitinophaga nivalis]|uniref:Uncharacterized protein n=1 Tax=Chitinophaga nivalis TaxID=2991709 RepID=A0ABT3IM72_9BACT|nr:hypothetical protein [Chitinophaga nivalis]MCW3465235.1 hypothetical protein [Chitinophaga nivalis]MCW3485073.1 hypothetical protein [Chitinophaga nivalis]
MIIKANLVMYKDDTGMSVVYCPEINVFARGQLIRDAKLSFLAIYPFALNTHQQSNYIKTHLLQTANWQVLDEQLVPPAYNTLEATQALYEHLEKEIPVLGVKKIEIVVPITTAN